jgi:anti-sigma factor RsiW
LEVDDHLLRCETCRERVALDRAIRGSLKKAVKMTAPADVRARVLAAMAAQTARDDACRAAAASAATGEANALVDAPPASGRPAMLRHWRTMIPLASAAAIALAWNLASDRPLAADNGGPSRLGAGFTNDDVINQLVEMHSRPIRPETPDPKEVRAFEREVGVPVHVPQLQNGNARFVGGRLLPMAGGERAAMLQYEVSRPNGGVERVSVFIFDPRRVQIGSADQLVPRSIGTAQVRVGQARGYSVAIAQHGSIGYAVASDLEDSSAQFVAAAERE